MPHVELRHFRYVIAVAEERSFRAAAERLHISQPSLSRQIREVEDQLGVPLFIRSKSGVALTGAGTAFVTEARRTLAQADRAVVAARACREEATTTLKVGFTTVLDDGAFPNVVERFARKFPSVRLVTRRMHSIKLVEQVQRGELDAAFVSMHTDPSALQAEIVRQEHVVIALGTSSPLARRRALQLMDMESHPLFWFERRLNPGYFDYWRSVFERLHVSPARLPEPADHHVLLGRIAAGEGWALMPDSMRGVRRDGVSFRPLKTPFPVSVGVVMIHAADNQRAALASLLALARRDCGETGPARSS